MDAQILKKHLWKERIVLIISNNDSSKKIQNQLNLFSNKHTEFKDRKLIVYGVNPKAYKRQDSGTWIRNSELYDLYNTSKDEFRIILVGLDGSIKVDQNKIITIEALFSKIDTMPMRRSELRN